MYLSETPATGTWILRLDLGLREWVSGFYLVCNLDVPTAASNVMIISTVVSMEEGKVEAEVEKREYTCLRRLEKAAYVYPLTVP